MTNVEKKELLKGIVDDAYEVYDKFYDTGLKGKGNLLFDNATTEEEKAVATTVRLIGVLLGRLYEDTIWNELPDELHNIQELYDALNY
jgi:hypothetical protein